MSRTPGLPAVLALAGAALALASCSSDIPGHRLEPWQVEASGTEPLVMGIYDTKEKVHCRFAADAAGQLRCLPVDGDAVWSSGYFADAACTQGTYAAEPRLAATIAGRAATVPLPSAGCGPERHEVVVLRPVASAAPLFAVGEAGCGPASPRPQDVALEDLVVESIVPPERYAAGTEVDGALVGGRLRVRAIESADGARFVHHLVDERWGKRCALTYDAVGCAVDAARFDTYFTDDACTDALASAASCQDPAFIHVDGHDYELGERWSGSVFQHIKGCFQIPDGWAASLPLYHLGAPLGGDAIAPVTWQTAGTGRFALRGLRADDGGVVPLGVEIPASYVRPFQDNVAGVDCSPFWTPGGEVRCLPPTVIIDVDNFDTFFADAACKQPANFCMSDTCDGRDFVTFELDAHGERRPAAITKAVEISGLEAFMRDSGGCRPMNDASFHFFVAGAPASWDAYPRLQERNGRASGAP